MWSPFLLPINSITKYELVIVTCLEKSYCERVHLFYHNKTKFHGVDPESQMGHDRFLATSTFTLDVLNNKT